MFFLEIAPSSASASLSDFASGKFSSRSSRIFLGTATSINESSDLNPSPRNIHCKDAALPRALWDRSGAR